MFFFTIIKRRIRFLIYFTVITWLFILNVNIRYPVRTYEHIKRSDMLENLLDGRIGNLNLTENLVDCDYDPVVADEGLSSLTTDEGDLPTSHGVRLGGEYSPANCKPKFSSAIIVPYRDRAEQLHKFLIFMHTFLRSQQIHYRIFIVEQIDTLLFNRGMLLNIGAKAAMLAGFPCLILHDVDLLPLRRANIYACSRNPRHMSSSIDKHRFLLKYSTMFGGAVAISSKHFSGINGMSNKYFGLGAEDDDLYYRLERHELSICRFEPEISQYHLASPLQSSERNNHILLDTAKSRIKEDGLNSLKDYKVETVMHPLFTHIMVDLTYRF